MWLVWKVLVIGRWLNRRGIQLYAYARIDTVKSWKSILGFADPLIAVSIARTVSPLATFCYLLYQQEGAQMILKRVVRRVLISVLV